jgi:hypothetical protein
VTAVQGLPQRSEISTAPEALVADGCCGTVVRWQGVGMTDRPSRISQAESERAIRATKKAGPRDVP